MKFYVVLLLLVCLTTVGCSKDIIDIKFSESIGYYSAGCIKNPVKLPDTGFGYQVIRLSRNRYYGHPDLIEFIEYLGENAKTRLNSTVLIGDLSQPTGGPMPPEHASHQTGLDADILYMNHNNGNHVLSISEREQIHPVSILTPDKRSIDKQVWNNKYTALLVLASAHPNVDRIFVNPVIKKELCKKHKGDEWLEKIRPWRGHDGHFHVRLRCPAGSMLCENQEPIEPGDGCGEDLAQWFTGKFKESKTKKIKRVMPQQCSEILSELPQTHTM